MWEVGAELPCPFQGITHYVGMSDHIIGHWLLIQPPAPPPSLRKGVGLKVPML